MNDLDHLNCLANAISSCVHKDAKEMQYKDVDWIAFRKSTDANKNFGNFYIDKVRRPDNYDVEVYAMFAQTWGSIALGFGGLGGSAMTTVYTIILLCNREFLVYWNGGFAYKTDDIHKVTEWVETRNTPALS